MPARDAAAATHVSSATSATKYLNRAQPRLPILLFVTLQRGTWHATPGRLYMICTALPDRRAGPDATAWLSGAGRRLLGR